MGTLKGSTNKNQNQILRHRSPNARMLARGAVLAWCASQLSGTRPCVRRYVYVHQVPILTYFASKQPHCKKSDDNVLICSRRSVKELLRRGHVLSHHPRIKDENLKFEVQTLKASNNTLPINLYLTFMFFSQILDSETVKRKKRREKRI